MQVEKTRIAALLTCHNRRETTLRCLRDLQSQTGTHARIEIFLVDDGSSDGTSASVSENFPSVHLIQGDGSLYWTGGMRLAMQAAYPRAFEFFLWLNDDTKLYADAVQGLMNTYRELSSNYDTPIIVVGSICDPDSGELTYGGSVRTNRWHPLRFRHMPPTAEPQRCDVFNGNCVLIPHEAVEIVGNLHPKLTHAAGDYEYALRANKRNVTTWIAPGFVGECAKNSLRNTWKDSSVPLLQRYKMIFGVKGQPPGPRLIYYSKHGGPFSFALYPLVYLRPVADFLKKMFFRQKI